MRFLIESQNRMKHWVINSSKKHLTGEFMSEFKKYLKQSINEGFFNDIIGAFKEGMVEGAYETNPELFMKMLEKHIKKDDMEEGFYDVLKSQKNYKKTLPFLAAPIGRMFKAEGGLKSVMKKLKGKK